MVGMPNGLPHNGQHGQTGQMAANGQLGANGQMQPNGQMGPHSQMQPNGQMGPNSQMGQDPAALPDVRPDTPASQALRVRCHVKILGVTFMLT